MEIKGKIVDNNGETLPLANVTIITGAQANKFGASADMNGEFSLSNSIIEPDSEFRISYIGFQPKILKASELQGGTIKLNDSSEELGEVVVMGKPISKPKVVASSLKTHIKKHGLVYASIGALAGIGLIITSIKK
jgi:hypothetical protein